MSDAQDNLDSLGLYLMQDSPVQPAQTFDVALAHMAEAIVGVKALDLSLGGAADYVAEVSEVRAATVVLQGATAARNLVVPALPFKRSFVNPSAFAITVKCALTAGVVVPATSQLELYCDGVTVALAGSTGGTPLTTEQVQDIVGAMFPEAIYDDATGTIDLPESGTATPTVTTLTGTAHTLVAANNNSVLRFTAATDVAVTVPSGLGLGFNVTMIQKGAGRIIVAAGAGVAVENRQTHTKSAGLHAMITLVADVADAFTLGGDTAA